MYLIVLCLLTSLLSACMDRPSKEDIGRLVRENENTLRMSIENNDYEAALEIPGIREMEHRKGIPFFYCGGAGFGPSTAYFGFYYAENDQPLNFMPAYELTPLDEGWQARQEHPGDNRYYTEQILPQFFYLEEFY